jgi:RNA ligase (TIGR02306 family)
MMERALASIQRILEVKEIPNADRIEEAVVLGWHLVVGKGEFKVGEKCVYFEVDSMLPLTPAFEFLKDKMKQYEGGEWFCRLRTKKLRGVLSQGLALPLGVLGLGQNLSLGEDVSERLGIKKYEPQIPAVLRGWAKGNFPTLYIPKTDEIRVQSIPEIFDEVRGKEVFVTEKADGTSVTYFVREEFGVCSRNLELKEDDEVAY